MYLLDTNICIALIKDNPKVVARFNPFFAQCYLSAIVVSELYKGAYCSRQVEKNIETILQLNYCQLNHLIYMLLRNLV